MIADPLNDLGGFGAAFDGAVGEPPYLLIRPFRCSSDDGQRLAHHRHVHSDTAIVDALIQLPHSTFSFRQRGQMSVNGALGSDVAFAIGAEPCESVFIVPPYWAVIASEKTARLAHLQHQPVAVFILGHIAAQRGAKGVQRRRQAHGDSAGHGAVHLLDLDDQAVGAEHGAFELLVMAADLAAVVDMHQDIVGCLVAAPRQDRAVVEPIRAQDDLGSRVLRVGVSTDLPQVSGGPGLDVDVEHPLAHPKISTSPSSAGPAAPKPAAGLTEGSRDTPAKSLFGLDWPMPPRLSSSSATTMADCR